MAALPISMYFSWPANFDIRVPLNFRMYAQTAGTMPKPVAWNSSIALKNSLRLAKLPTSTIVAPFINVQRRRPSPKEWHNGNPNTSTSCSVLPMNPLMLSADEKMLKCDSMTPFGRPVVPVVKTMSAVSSAVMACPSVDSSRFP